MVLSTGDQQHAAMDALSPAYEEVGNMMKVKLHNLYGVLIVQSQGSR
jgi:hypothetical protein